MIGSALPLPAEARFGGSLRPATGILRLGGEDPSDALVHLARRAFDIRLVRDDDDPDVIVRRAVVDAPSAAGVDPRPAPQVESYRVETRGSGWILTAGSDEAAFRGVTTLAALARAAADADEGLPEVEILDYPRYAWRGLSLDVVRRWFPVDEVERVIDLLALHKFSVLHLHLTDTQAWRFAVPGYPSVTSGVDHYSASDLDHLRTYARDRFVTIIPEIDIPGHVAPTVGVGDDIHVGEAAHPFLRYLDVSSPGVAPFLSAAITELAARFDAPFLHLGGDEAFGAPHDAYVQAVREVAALVRGSGRRVIGWQETVRSDALTSDDLSQLWIAERDRFDVEKALRQYPAEFHPLVRRAAALFALAVDDPARLGRAGVPVIVSSSDPLYLDRRPSDPSIDPAQSSLWERLGMPAYEPTPTTDILEWDPTTQQDIVDSGVTVGGVEAALWCESVESFEDVARLLLPRLALVAQRAWSPAAGDRDAILDAAARDASCWRRLGFPEYYQSKEVFGR